MSRIIDVDVEFDFGFIPISEDELSARDAETEERARKEAEDIIKEIQNEAWAAINEAAAAAEEYKDRLELLYKTLQPLLNDLLKDADDKPYIYWPERKRKIEMFKAKVEAIVTV
jgi:cell division septum initiation protein DivIVA